MADYIYLLENRLSASQRMALGQVREVARQKNLTLFLVGGAVRDLTSGSPVRDLDVVLVGNALKLKKDLEKAGAVLDGEHEQGQALYLSFPGQVRMEVGSALTVTYPKPGKAVYKPATILEDLRRRDFTANAMALSLNEGSFGLLMDPLNGVADIENRELRLVSNYGFIEEPVRMIRAARLLARLGWNLEEKTQTRYETGRQEGYISALNDFHRGYETEEIFHEEDPLRVLKRLEAEGWMKVLAPFLTSAKVNVAELERLREVQTQLQMQGIQPDSSAASFPLLTAKLSAKEIADLKSSFPRQGFVRQVESLDAQSKELTAQLSGKATALPSQTWRLLTSAPSETVLQVAFSSKSAPVQAKFKSFASDWPQARTRMPYPLMQEMRITADLPAYAELLEKLFFELIDGHLATPEEMKAFLEPYSPPAPPPPVSMRRLRGKKEAKPAKSRSKKTKTLDDFDGDADHDQAGESEDDVASEIAAVLDDEQETLEIAAGEVDSELDADDAVESMAEGDKIDKIGKTDEAAETDDATDEEPAVAARLAGKRASKKVPAKSAPVPARKAVAPAKKAPEPATSAIPATSKEPQASKEVVAARKLPAKKTSPQAAEAKPAPKAPKAKPVPAASQKSPASRLTPAKKAPVKISPPAKVAAKPATARKAAPAKGATRSIPSPAAGSKVAKKSPAKAVSVKSAPAKTSPVKAAPAKAVPAKAIPKKAVPAKTVAAKKAAAKTVAAKKNPARKDTAKPAPAKSVPAKSAPAKSVPAKAKRR